ncbi:OST-HTH/LOTUS domain-containing protein [Bradyrhizobium barranii subsp. apii]|uniref:OST-HTH/LOTUS domain-containing protein n=1 Tax=Bradyrhizobium barranii subsp. apii TaxID=2819348 RepID=A0A8U0FPN0_9BRAD|nr:OST-HTH/LOTUS domain-containing protein [Bradyrhizobium barranii]UPT88411.1 OST-HTH/LOTUS domain-containing protein [Bradyrhizobium barranii subsp. apii]
MSVAALNNRLLQKTFRTFQSRDYGADSLKELLEAFKPAFELKEEKGGSTVTFHDLSLSAASLVTRATAPDQQAESPVSVGAGRIRADLWTSIMDYSSGNRYVWDERKGIARKASNDDTGPLLPTIRSEEFRTWRAEFLTSAKATLAPEDRAIATRWCEKLLPTSSLPPELQAPWNKELSRRVRDRLSSFFSSRDTRSLDDEVDQKEFIGSDQAADEEMTAAIDSGEFFLVGELVARRLEQKSGVDASTALARMVAAWSTTKGSLLQPDSVPELVGRLDALPTESVALALVSAIRRLRVCPERLPWIA